MTNDTVTFKLTSRWRTLKHCCEQIHPVRQNNSTWQRSLKMWKQLASLVAMSQRYSSKDTELWTHFSENWNTGLFSRQLRLAIFGKKNSKTLWKVRKYSIQRHHFPFTSEVVIYYNRGTSSESRCYTHYDAYFNQLKKWSQHQCNLSPFYPNKSPHAWKAYSKSFDQIPTNADRGWRSRPTWTTHAVMSKWV